MIFSSKTNKQELQYVLFEVTQDCNLNCSFCYNHWKGNFKEQKQNSSDYSQSLQTLKRLFRNSNINHITITGGEPLLVDRLKELALFCRLKGASVSVISNGNAGKDEDIRQLLQIGVSLFELPFHSNKASIHDQMTHLKGSWEKSKERMLFIRNEGGYVVPVIVITKFNYNTLGETISTLSEMGFNRIMLNRYNIGGLNVLSPNKVIASKEQLNEAFKQANEVSGKLKLGLSSNVCTPHCIVNPTDYTNIRFTNCSPDLYKRPLTLSSTGDIRFCNHSPIVLGNIFNLSIKEILADGQKISNTISKPSYCIECTLYDKCQGGCRAAAQQTGKAFSDIDPIVEYINCEVKI